MSNNEHELYINDSTIKDWNNCLREVHKLKLEQSMIIDGTEFMQSDKGLIPN
jgi:hypothetical protein